jgi:acetate kinase
MGTRPGAIDPGVLLHLLRDGMTREELERLLYHDSGVKGVSGLTADMKTLLESSDPKAKLAIALYCYRIRRELGSLAAALGGLDAIVFTAGIGEGSALVRERVCRRLAFLGVELDASRNSQAEPDSDIAADGSAVRVLVIAAREEIVAARAARTVLARDD